MVVVCGEEGIGVGRLGGVDPKFINFNDSGRNVNFLCKILV